MARGVSDAMPRLVQPAAMYRESFLAALAEYQAEGRLFELDARALAARHEFSRYVAALVAEVDWPGEPFRYAAALAGREPPAEPEGGYVPQTTFWWASGREYLGRISIRHWLTPDLLRHGGHIGYEVRPSARGHGHATAMLAAVLPLAAKLGIDPACLDCLVENTASRCVIEKNGGRLHREEGGWLYYHVPTGIRP